MKPIKGTNWLRKGRHDSPGLYYVLTAVTVGRQPLLKNPNAALAVLSTMRWLDANDRITLEVGVVMPDHFHMVVRREEKSTSTEMHSLKGGSRFGKQLKKGPGDNYTRRGLCTRRSSFFLISNPELTDA